MKMNHGTIAAALAAALSLSSVTADAVVDKTPANENAGLDLSKAVRDEAGRILYFVQFEEAPVVSQLASLRTLGTGTGRARFDPQGAKAVELRGRMAAAQERMLESISSTVHRPISAINRYQLVLNAVTAYLTEQEAQVVRGLPGIERLTAVQVHELATDTGPAFIGAPAIWNGTDGGTPETGEGVLFGIMDTGIRPDHPSFHDLGEPGYVLPEEFASLGIDIGDAPFDHVNPFGEGNYLGACAEPNLEHLCNDKLVGIVGYDEILDKLEQVGPRAAIDYNSHGTHVASTVAGNPLENVPIDSISQEEFDDHLVAPRISGVAPRANIISYQVCDPVSGCFPHLTVQALEHAVENGVEVMNYSVGGGPADPWANPAILAFLNARAAGIHIAVAIGNDGPSPETAAAPGNAPWVNGVGALTHDRALFVDLTDFTGGAAPLAGVLTGQGVTGEYEAAIVHAASVGNPFCEEFPPGIFDGEIVVCDRGEITLGEKSENLLAAGAGGMVLVNTAESNQEVFANAFQLPAVHLDREAGDILRNWLGAGEGHRARIAGMRLGIDPASADVITDFSSRGPHFVDDLPAPHMAAPGAAVFAASVSERKFFDNSGAPFELKWGTSMASPHVAGALVLLKQRQPAWTPAEVQSALMLTAEPVEHARTLTETDDGFVAEIVTATPFDAGAGSIRVNRAVHAGLVMDISEQEYRDADPSAGGDPGALNLAALMDAACIIECDWQREFRATMPGNWTISFETEEEGLRVTADPATFSVNAGDRQAVRFSASYDGTKENEYLFGRVVLQPGDDASPVLRMPVAIQARAGYAPEEVRILSGRDADVLAIPGVATNGPETLHWKFSGFDELERYVDEIPGDATPENFDDENYQGPFQVLVLNVTPDVAHLVANIAEAESADLDLFLHRDHNLNGLPDEGRAACASAGPNSDERCVINDIEPGQYLVTVHNFGGDTEGSDRHVLEIAMIRGEDHGQFTLLEPPALPVGTEIELAAYWDNALEPGEAAIGELDLGTSDVSRDNIGSVTVIVERGEDDIRLVPGKPVLLPGEETAVVLHVAANRSGMARTLHVNLAVPPALEVMGDVEDATVDENQIRWAFDRPVDAPAMSATFTIRAKGSVEGYVDARLAAVHHAETPIIATPDETAEALLIVDVPPTARINGDAEHAATGEEGSSLTLSSTGSRSSRDGDVLSFKWTQVSGPTLGLSGQDGETVNVSLPDVSGEATATLQLVVDNGRLQSEPAHAVITIRPKKSTPNDDGGSGGGGGAMLFLLPVLMVFRRWAL